MTALIGFLMIALIVILLLKGKMSPIVVLALIPAAAALILGHGPQQPRSWPWTPMSCGIFSFLFRSSA